MMEELIKELQLYAGAYREPPYGREAEGTQEILEKAAKSLQEAKNSVESLKHRYMDGMEVHYQGDDADDEIECPFCGYGVARNGVARNDDYSEFRPNHCPECGTKLIY